VETGDFVTGKLVQLRDLSFLAARIIPIVVAALLSMASGHPSHEKNRLEVAVLTEYPDSSLI
jgi:hypothetical protein